VSLQAESAVDPVDTAAGLGVGCAVERSCCEWCLLHVSNVTDEVSE
jgi:hypothetical protein